MQKSKVGKTSKRVVVASLECKSLDRFLADVTSTSTVEELRILSRPERKTVSTTSYLTFSNISLRPFLNRCIFLVVTALLS